MTMTMTTTDTPTGTATQHRCRHCDRVVPPSTVATVRGPLSDGLGICPACGPTPVWLVVAMSMLHPSAGPVTLGARASESWVIDSV